MRKDAMPDEFVRIVMESDELLERIKVLRAKPRLTLTDLKELVDLKLALRRVCPPGRFGWLDGRPVIDILKTTIQLEKENKIS
jgi:hypothetical protein